MGDAFKALSDPTRRKILELLQEKPLNAGEIADYFQISLDQLVRVGLHPEKPADPFASLPKDMQGLLSTYQDLNHEDQKQVRSYSQFLRDR